MSVVGGTRAGPTAAAGVHAGASGADREVVVTGAAGGIGRAIVEDLAGRGCTLVAVDVNRAVEELKGPGVQPVVADLAGSDGVAAVLDAVAGRPLHGLANVAGLTRDGLLHDLSDDAIDLVLRVNAGAAIRLALALADRIAEGGAIVSISSRAHLGNVGQVNYAASKGALVGATRALAQRLAPRVRVNAVAPGLVRTEMTEAMPPAVLDKLVARVPFARLGEVDEVAAVVAWLLSDDSVYVTGQTLYVCGGRSI